MKTRCKKTAHPYISQRIFNVCQTTRNRHANSKCWEIPWSDVSVREIIQMEDILTICCKVFDKQ
jgi:hypothetical protein